MTKWDDPEVEEYRTNSSETIQALWAIAGRSFNGNSLPHHISITGELAPLAALRIAGVRITNVNENGKSHSPWCSIVRRHNYNIEFTSLGQYGVIERARVRKYGNVLYAPGGQCSLCGGYASEPLNDKQVELVKASASFIETEQKNSPTYQENLAFTRKIVDEIK